MNEILKQATQFLSNLNAYPVVSTTIILILFVVLARFAVVITGRMIGYFSSGDNAEIAKKLRDIAEKPIWIIFLIFGVMFVLEWLNLFPLSRSTIQSVLGTLALLVSIVTINRVVSEVCTLWLESKKRAVETIGQIEKVAKALVVVVGFFLLMGIWNIDLAPLLASAGFAGIVLAVSAKDSLSNLFGGLSLALDKPFNLGDTVVLENGERGKVLWIGPRSTIILTRDDVQISIPNSIMANTRIKNESAPEPRHRIRIEVNVAYGSNFDQIEKTLCEAANENKKISTFPEPRVRFRAFGDSAIKFELLCWTKLPEDRGVVIHQLGKMIYETFEIAKIKIPFPQRDVHVHH